MENLYSSQSKEEQEKLFSEFKLLMKEASINAYREGYTKYKDAEALLNPLSYSLIKKQLEVQDFFIDRFKDQVMLSDNSPEASKKSAYRLMFIFQTETKRAYNWGIFNALKELGEIKYEVYDINGKSVISSMLVSETKYEDLPPYHPNSQVTIRKINESS
jgi:hypothetical protein